MMGPRHMSFSGRARTKPMAVYDRWLVFAAVALMAIGLLMVASSSSVISEKMFHYPFHYISRQLIFFVAGLVGALIVIRIDSEIWHRMSGQLLILTLILLVLVLIPALRVAT